MESSLPAGAQDIIEDDEHPEDDEALGVSVESIRDLRAMWHAEHDNALRQAMILAGKVRACDFMLERVAGAVDPPE